MEIKLYVSKEENDTQGKKRSFVRTFLLVVAIIFLISFAFFLLPDKLVNSLVRENGPIETAQFLLYLTGALVALFFATKKTGMDGLLVGILLGCFAMRELDLQKKFTGISITRTKFYFSPDISVSVKIIGGIIVLGILITLILLIKRNIRKLLLDLRNKESSANFTMTGIVLLPIAAVSDASLRFLKNISIESGDKVGLMKTVFEETIELAIPLVFLIALFKWKKGAQDN